MTIKEKIIKQKGKYLITYKDNTKIVIDLDNMLYDSQFIYDYDKMQQTLTIEQLDVLLKNIKSIKKI